MFAVIAGNWLAASWSVTKPGRFSFGYWRIDAWYGRRALAFLLVCQAARGRAIKKKGALKPPLKATNVVFFSHILGWNSKLMDLKTTWLKSLLWFWWQDRMGWTMQRPGERRSWKSLPQQEISARLEERQPESDSSATVVICSCSFQPFRLNGDAALSIQKKGVCPHLLCWLRTGSRPPALGKLTG